MTHWTKGAALAAAIGVATSGAAAAPFVDLEASAGMTLPQLNSGGFGDDVSLTDDPSADQQLDLSAENGFYLAGRVGVPILPDVKLRFERLNFSNSNYEQTFNAFGEEFSADGEIYLDMSYIDTAFVYGIPNLVPGIDYFVDFGVNLRWLIGGVEAEIDGGGRQEESFPIVPIPSGHLAAGATIPIVDVQLSGELNTLPLDGINYNDWNVKARWFLPLPLAFVGKIGVEAGYRNWTVDIDGRDSALIDNDDLRLDFDTSGYFLGTSVSF